MTKPSKPGSATDLPATSSPASETRLPHERDESNGDVDAEPRAVIRQAKADIDSGKQATDRGEATDAAYRRQKEPK